MENPDHPGGKQNHVVDLCYCMVPDNANSVYVTDWCDKRGIIIKGDMKLWPFVGELHSYHDYNYGEVWCNCLILKDTKAGQVSIYGKVWCNCLILKDTKAGHVRSYGKVWCNCLIFKDTKAGHVSIYGKVWCNGLILKDTRAEHVSIYGKVWCNGLILKDTKAGHVSEQGQQQTFTDYLCGLIVK